MEKNKVQSTLRITFSAIALGVFVIFSLISNLMVNEYTTYSTYGWRLGVLNDLFLSVPFLALLVFAILERKLNHINSRVYVVGIFGLYAIQSIAISFFDGASDFSVLCCSLGRLSDIVVAIIVVRSVMLFLILVAHKIMLKIYSLGMIALLAIFLYATLTSDYLMLSSESHVIFAVLVDIFFHIALFFFNGLLDKKNESTPWLCFLGSLTYPIFGSLFEDDDECDDDDDDVLSKHSRPSYSAEYKSLFIAALNEEDKEFLCADLFLRKLSEENVFGDDGQIYSADDFSSNLAVIAKKIESINAIKPAFISDKFRSLIELLIAEKDEDSFKMDVIAVAKMLFRENTSQWISAAKQHTEYIDDTQNKET